MQRAGPRPRRQRADKKRPWSFSAVSVTKRMWFIRAIPAALENSALTLAALMGPRRGRSVSADTEHPAHILVEIG